MPGAADNRSIERLIADFREGNREVAGESSQEKAAFFVSQPI